jgi:hypothetical protein
MSWPEAFLYAVGAVCATVVALAWIRMLSKL